MYGKLDNWWSEVADIAMASSAAVGRDAGGGAGGVDDALAGWLGKEFTIDSSNLNDHIPVGGKLTFIYDSDENVVRVCTRTGP